MKQTETFRPWSHTDLAECIVCVVMITGSKRRQLSSQPHRNIIKHKKRWRTNTVFSVLYEQWHRAWYAAVNETKKELLLSLTESFGKKKWVFASEPSVQMLWYLFIYTIFDISHLCDLGKEFLRGIVQNWKKRAAFTIWGPIIWLLIQTYACHSSPRVTFDVTVVMSPVSKPMQK